MCNRSLLVKGVMRRAGRGWDLSFFLAVRKQSPQLPLALDEGGSAGSSSAFDAHPRLNGGIPCRLFIGSSDLMPL